VMRIAHNPGSAQSTESRLAFVWRKLGATLAPRNRRDR
jgi:hypothetical protein